MSHALAISTLPSYLADPEFGVEKDGAKDEVRKWWPVFVELLGAKPRAKAIMAKAKAMGVREGTLRGNFYAWLKAGGDWRVLIDRAKWPEPDRAAFPPAFETWYVNLYESHQRDRTGARTYGILLARLSAWEKDPHNPELAIPGYILPPRRSPYTHHPVGWSERNLYRLLERRSNVYERTIRRQGTKAASIYLPSIHTDRAKLAFGQIFYFDDSQHDVYVNLTGRNPKAMRPLSFNCLEALSGSLCLLGLKPQLHDPTTGGRRELDQLDFFWFVMQHLTTTGYNPVAGTALLWEHGTANIDRAANFDEAIRAATGGKVIVDRSGKFGPPAFKAMLFEGQSSGNFRFKAPIESFFQNVRTYSALLPAPTGLNPDRAPEESYGLLRRNAGLQRMIDKIDPQTFLRLRRPVLEWEDYARLCRSIHQAIDGRRDHALQGYPKLGFNRQFYRFGLDHENWISEHDYAKIPAVQRAALDHIVAQDGYFKTEQLSPAEVFAAHRPQLRRLPISLIPTLAPPRAWEAVTVAKSLEIEINDQWVDSEPLRYLAKVADAKGREIILERGKTYRRLLNPFDPTLLFIADRDGAFIGTATRLHAPGKLDYEGIIEQLGAVNHIRAVENAEVFSRMAPAAAQRVEDYHFNKNLLGGKPATDEERAAARGEVRREREAARFGAASGESLPASAPIDEPEPTVVEDWTAEPDFSPAEPQPHTDPETW